MQWFISFFSTSKRYIFNHKKISITVVALLLIGIFIFRPKALAQIDTQTITADDLVQTVSVSGSVDALTKVDLSFLTSGQLTYLGARKNDTITAGQLIAQEDDRTVEKNLQSALITASQARNTFDQTIQDNKDKVLTDSVERILQNNQYDLDKSVNSVELQDLARQQSMIISPIAGILTREDAESVGTTALAGTTIFEIVDPTSLVFSMDVDEADVGKVRIGQPVTLTLDAYPDTELHLTVASIDYVSHTTSNGGTAYSVRVKLPGSDIAKYRIGMSGNADIITAEKKSTVSVPLSAIFNDSYVYVKTNNTYVQRKVRLGLQNDTDAEVVSGLSAGDVVALEPSKVPQQLIKSK